MGLELKSSVLDVAGSDFIGGPRDRMHDVHTLAGVHTEYSSCDKNTQSTVFKYLDVTRYLLAGYLLSVH